MTRTIADLEPDIQKRYPYKSNFTNVNGWRMHYVDEGPKDATPVLLLQATTLPTTLHSTLKRSTATRKVARLKVVSTPRLFVQWSLRAELFCISSHAHPSLLTDNMKTNRRNLPQFRFTEGGLCHVN